MLPSIRAALQLRLQLLPYLYQISAEYHFEGTPPIRPLQLSFAPPHDAAAIDIPTLDATANPYEAPADPKEIKDQYLLGDSLLVAPLAPTATRRKVVLPPGRWYDFYSGRLAGENTTIEVEPTLEQILLFVRDGAIIPRLAGAPLRAPQAGERPALELWHYGEQPGQLRLYDDDGETFAYESGAFS